MRILMIMAHPDDEVIFGWPIIQNKEHEVFLVTLSDNRNHGAGPIKALEEVCAENNICLLTYQRIPNNFYQTPTRYQKVILRDNVITPFEKYIRQAIDHCKPQYIFTHNPVGEYGHGDHRLVFNLVSQLSDIPLLLTDICFYNKCHLSSDKMPWIYHNCLYQGYPCTYHELNIDWYERMKAVYEKNKAWSWSGHEPVKDCSLYYFE